MSDYNSNFLASVLLHLHEAVCKEAIVRKIDLSPAQVELIYEIASKAVLALKNK